MALLASGSNSGWSINLRIYGYHRGELGNAYDYTSHTRIAASENVVSLAIDNLAPTSRITKPYGYAEASWTISLFFFDAHSGKLLAEAGPWTSGLAFQLFSNSQGNFLLHLWNHSLSSTQQKRGESLLLISPVGGLLKELPLWDTASETDQAQRHDWRVLISPTRKMLLVSQSQGGGCHYELLDANTLAKQSEWNDVGDSYPTILAITDTQLMAVRKSTKQPQSSVSNEENEVVVRTFGGEWRRFGASTGSWKFLSDTTIAGLVEVPGKSDLGPNAYRLVVERDDGTSLLSAKIEEKDERLTLPEQIVTSPDARHVAGLFDLVSTWRIWRELDMGPERAVLYVWAVPNPEPVLKLKVNDQFANYCFSPDGSWVAIADRMTLRMIRIPN